MEWSDLRVFLAVACEGTLGAAARKLGQTQPTMGRRLRALEAAVGQVLFQRTGEGFVLTDEGASVLGHAERVARLCSDGGGLAVLPRPLGDATPHIAAFELGEQPPGRDIFVGYHRDLRRLTRMRELLALVIEKLAN